MAERSAPPSEGVLDEDATGPREDASSGRGRERSPGSVSGWAWWGVAGVTFLFLSAAWRLGARGVETVRAGLSPAEWGALAALLVVFVYGEGYRALQRKYVPHVLERLGELGPERNLLHRLLAPLYGMALVDEEAARTVRPWLGVAAIVAAVLIVRAFPEPWRGITDLAVGGALFWGAVTMVVQAGRSLSS